jgi:hypothetical protein
MKNIFAVILLMYMNLSFAPAEGAEQKGKVVKIAFATGDAVNIRELDPKEFTDWDEDVVLSDAYKKFPVKGQLSKGVLVEVNEVRGAWAHISFEDINGWVAKQYLEVYESIDDYFNSLFDRRSHMRSKDFDTQEKELRFIKSYAIKKSIVEFVSRSDGSSYNIDIMYCNLIMQHYEYLLKILNDPEYYSSSVKSDEIEFYKKNSDVYCRKIEELCGYILVNYPKGDVSYPYWGEGAYREPVKVRAYNLLMLVALRRNDEKSFLKYAHKMISECSGMTHRGWENVSYPDYESLQSIIRQKDRFKWNSGRVIIECLKGVEETKNEMCKAGAYLAIGNEYLLLKDYNNALRYFDLVIDKYPYVYLHMFSDIDLFFSVDAYCAKIKLYKINLKDSNRAQQTYDLLVKHYELIKKKFIKPDSGITLENISRKIEKCGD